MFDCPNPHCRKSFPNPLKTLNLQQDPTKPYNACPYCLTEINGIPLELPSTAERATQQIIAEPQTGTSKDKPAGCLHYLGYLSERTQKTQIPDNCLLCRDIVECMLKKMR